MLGGWTGMKLIAREKTRYIKYSYLESVCDANSVQLEEF